MAQNRKLFKPPLSTEMSGVINIFGKIFLRGISLELTRLNKMFRYEFTKIRHEFEEHLQAINENTNEISANYEYICEIESKMDRLSERIDNIQLFLEANSGMAVAKSTEGIVNGKVLN